jgi:hypothetical protein
MPSLGCRGFNIFVLQKSLNSEKQGHSYKTPAFFARERHYSNGRYHYYRLVC